MLVGKPVINGTGPRRVDSNRPIALTLTVPQSQLTDMGDDNLDLSTLITAVRSELEKADAAVRSARKEALFRLSGLELELNFVVKTTDAVKGGFDLKIVSLGSSLGSTSEEVQRVKVKFDVVRRALDQEVLGTRFSDEGGEGPRPQSVTPIKK